MQLTTKSIHTDFRDANYRKKNSYLSQPLKLLFKMKTLKFHPLSFQFTSRYITLNSQHNGESYFLLNCDSLRFRLHVHEFDLVKNNFEAN